MFKIDQKRNCLTLILTLCIASLLSGQSYVCPDFTNLKSPYVEGHYGRTYAPFAYSGFIDGRHTEITEQGTDPNTGNILQFLPPGESKVIRLGNAQIGAEAEALTYHLTVDPDNPILLVKFAVVFQDPGHQGVEQPRFVMRIMDEDGSLIESCSEYDVSARAEIEGFQSYGAGGHVPIRWRDWTNVGLDMSAFAGKQVQVQFITYDCSLSGHYGYAYFTASCVYNKLRLNVCTGNTFTVEAPGGFASYLWDNGDRTHISTRTKTDNDMTLSCIVTSATGCRFTLSAYVSSTFTPTQNNEITDEICQGEGYDRNRFNLPPQTQFGTFVFYNTYLNPNTCSGAVTDQLTLTVHQTHYPLKASICQGESYTDNGFNIQNPAVGIKYDTLHLKSTKLGCDSIVCLELIVSSSFNMPNTLTGDANPCSNELVTYSFAGSVGLTSYQWETPANAHILSGQGTNQVRLYFTDDTPGNIILNGENGCGAGTVTLPVKPRQSYENLIIDSICSGEIYNRHNFNLGRQDDTGYFSYYHDEKTTSGCDSTTTLVLFVFPTPTIDIAVQNDTVLCFEQTVTLYAVPSNTSVVFAPIPKVAIGDILCTDGSIVKPNAYAASGKTAEAVVFYVDKTGEHGWAVDLRNLTYNLRWSDDITFDIPTMDNHPTVASALMDFDGYGNTLKMRAAMPDPTLLAWAPDISQGWYIPAMGQLEMMICVSEKINPTLTMLFGNFTGTVSKMVVYWSSTEAGADKCYTPEHSGWVTTRLKNSGSVGTRAIKDF